MHFVEVAGQSTFAAKNHTAATLADIAACLEFETPSGLWLE